jgi:hypothetical protein
MVSLGAADAVLERELADRAESVILLRRAIPSFPSPTRYPPGS